jgi:YD repeat-containing protein
MKIIYSKTLLSLAAILLTACGGSSDGSSDGTNTGYFTDSAVGGLTYATASQSGVTDTSGAFKYKEGETITFSIGDVLIGQTVSATSDMTPLDLVPDDVLYTTTAEVTKMYKNQNSAERKAFNKLSNILTFLQSLDNDSDPSNGIVIADGISALFAGVSIDFEQDFTYFEDYPTLRVITNKATGMGLLNSGNIPKRGFALDHFYQAQGINHNLSVAGTMITDSDANGAADYTDTVTYDAKGNMLTQSFDNNKVGTAGYIAYTNTFTYDAKGNRLTQSGYNDADGTADYTDTFTYAANGNQLTRSRDNDADGTPVFTDTYTYDASGNQLTWSRYNDAYGTADFTSTYTYDASGNLLTWSSYNDANGTDDYTYTFTYDAKGNQLTESLDNNADGTADYTSTSTYDANGHQLTYSSVQVGNDANGTYTSTSTYTYTYDASGNQLTRSYANDNKSSTSTYTYNAKGNMLTESNYNDVTSTTDSAYTYTYTYDANGNKLTESRYDDVNKTTDRIIRFTPINATWRALLLSLYLGES